MDPKKVLIIGGGIAGLSTGIYLRKSGLETEILEMHSIAGGLATAWKRQGYTFENCVHWLTGSKAGEEMNDLWKEVFDISAVEFYDDGIYQVIERNGQSLVIYKDVDRFEQELLAKAPEDAAAIRELTGFVRKLTSFRIPGGDTLAARLLSLARALPYFWWIGKYRKYTLSEYARKFTNPLMQAFLTSGLGELSFLALAFMLAWMSRGNAGYPLGGSLRLIGLMEDGYRKLGGNIRFHAKVNKIIVKDGKATGVTLEGGEQICADIVVSAADGHATIYRFLEGKFLSPELTRVHKSYKPFPSYVQVSIGIDADLKSEPGCLALFLEKKMEIDPETREDCLSFRIFHFDPHFAPAGKTAVVCFLATFNHAYWVSLRETDRTRYESEKERIAGEVLRALEQRVPAAKGNIEVVDVATPATVIRYTGNWKGSMEGWLMTPSTGIRQLPCTLPRLKDFYMVGQWISPGGGLPSGLLTARNVTQRLCRDHGTPWKGAQKPC